MTVENFTPVSAAGNSAGNVGLAGAVTFTGLNSATRTFIALGAEINALSAGINPDHVIALVAASHTRLLHLAGASEDGTILGAGAGLNTGGS